MKEKRKVLLTTPGKGFEGLVAKKKRAKHSLPVRQRPEGQKVLRSENEVLFTEGTTATRPQGR